MLAASNLEEARKAEIAAHIASPEFRKEFSEKFDRFDFDRDHRMDSTELAVALSRVGRKVRQPVGTPCLRHRLTVVVQLCVQASVDITQHSVDMVLSEFDADGNGYLGKVRLSTPCLRPLALPYRFVGACL